MKKLLFAVAVAASVAYAEENETDENTNEAAPAETAAAAKKAPPKVQFTTLPFCRYAEGSVQVCRPGSEWEDIVEGKFYPLGSSYRTGANARLVVAFGPESSVTLSGSSEFGTRVESLGNKTRTISLVRGTVELKLADNTPEGLFFVAAPGFKVKNPAGESRYVYEDMGDGDRVTLRCITGSLGVEGRHFEIPVMRSANEIIIRSNHDYLSTILSGTSGDYIVKLAKDMRFVEKIGDDGQRTSEVERQFEDWHLTPKTKVIINRSVPAVGERMSVLINAYDAAGERQGEGITICEGRAELNSGSLVSKEALSSDELAKRAAEATETTAATDVEESGEEKAKDGESTDNE